MMTSLYNRLDQRKIDMKKLMLVTAIISLSGLMTANAEVAKKAPSAPKKPVMQWTCADYLQVNETFQPYVVGYAAAMNSKGQVQDAIIDVDGLETIKPAIDEVCKSNPNMPFSAIIEQIETLN